jgi:hypothetical protein
MWKLRAYGPTINGKRAHEPDSIALLAACRDRRFADRAELFSPAGDR